MITKLWDDDIIIRYRRSEVKDITILCARKRET